MHNHVARDHDLELVVGDDLRLRMIVATMHVGFRGRLLAILDIDACAGERCASCTEGQKNRDHAQFFHIVGSHCRSWCEASPMSICYLDELIWRQLKPCSLWPRLSPKRVAPRQRAKFRSAQSRSRMTELSVRGITGRLV